MFQSHRRPRARRPWRVGVAALAASWLLALLPAAPGALAGTYDVYWCETPDGANVPAAPRFGWGSAAYITASSTCGKRGGEIVLSTGNLERPTFTTVRASVFAPSGSTIERVTADRTAELAPGVAADLSASPFASLWTSSAPSPEWKPAEPSDAREQCAQFAGCDWLAGPMTIDVPGSTMVQWQVGCGGLSGGHCAGAFGDRARLTLNALHFVVDDPRIPTGSASTGLALGTGAHSGVETAAVSGADGESGVLRFVALLDGVVAGSAGAGEATCRDESFAPGPRDYTAMVPCPQKLERNLSVDTRVVPDGQRHLEIRVYDAAGNFRTLHDARIAVDNVPPPVSVTAPTIAGETFPNALRPGDALVGAPGAWRGTGLSFRFQWQRRLEADDWMNIPGATSAAYTVVREDIGRKLRLAVTAHNADGDVVAYSEASGVVDSGATVQVASAGPFSSGGEASPQLVVDREQRTVQVRYGAKIMITGRLVDADGAPIGDADVEVFEQVSVVGAPWSKVATVHTDAQGGYSYRPLTRGSRVIRFAYSAKRDTGDYRATREVVIAVTAAMSIRAARRTIGSRGLIHLKGRVRAKPFPAAGAWVEIQVLDAGVWRTIGTRKTSKSGRWSFKHRVRSVSRVTFAFRARLRQIPTVPATESKSAAVKVRVR